jgi:general secretion pathway protein F
MAIYTYRATTLSGEVLEGAIEAADQKAAVERLKLSGLIPLKVFTAQEGLKRKLVGRSSRADLLTFTTELSVLLSAGLPLDRSLNILAEILENRETKAIVQGILKSIREGSSFSDALERHPRMFTRLYVNMVRAGEAGGVLDAVLEKLNEFLETTKELRDSVVSSAIYPLILLGTGGLSVIVLLTYVLPKFSAIFAELGGARPLPTKILLTVSQALQDYWWAAGLAVALAVYLFRKYIGSPAGRVQWDRFKLRVLRDLITKLETARFCRTLGTLLRSGVPLLQALPNAKDVIGNRVMAAAIDGVTKGVKEGKGIAVPLSAAQVLPPLALSMIKVGEETGQLDAMLMKVANTYEKSLRIAVKRFVSLMEPALILGMGLVIGFIVLSMLIAIFSITDLPF